MLSAVYKEYCTTLGAGPGFFLWECAPLREEFNLVLCFFFEKALGHLRERDCVPSALSARSAHEPTFCYLNVLVACIYTTEKWVTDLTFLAV